MSFCNGKLEVNYVCSHWFQVILLSKGIYFVCIMSITDDE